MLGRVAGDSLDPELGGGKKAHRRLVAIGWSRQRSQGIVEFVAGVELSHTDQLAAMAVAALRDVFGVTHPEFFAGDVGIGDDPDLPYAESGCVMEEPLAVWAAGRENLDQLVDQALTRVLASVPDRDADGDIGVISGTAVVFVLSTPVHPRLTSALHGSLPRSLPEHKDAHKDVTTSRHNISRSPKSAL